MRPTFKTAARLALVCSICILAGCATIERGEFQRTTVTASGGQVKSISIQGKTIELSNDKPTEISLERSSSDVPFKVRCEGGAEESRTLVSSLPGAYHFYNILGFYWTFGIAVITDIANNDGYDYLDQSFAACSGGRVSFECESSHESDGEPYADSEKVVKMCGEDTSSGARRSAARRSASHRSSNSSSGGYYSGPAMGDCDSRSESEMHIGDFLEMTRGCCQGAGGVFSLQAADCIIGGRMPGDRQAYFGCMGSRSYICIHDNYGNVGWRVVRARGG